MSSVTRVIFWHSKPGVAITQRGFLPRESSAPRGPCPTRVPSPLALAAAPVIGGSEPGPWPADNELAWIISLIRNGPRNQTTMVDVRVLKPIGVPYHGRGITLSSPSYQRLRQARRPNVPVARGIDLNRLLTVPPTYLVFTLRRTQRSEGARSGAGYQECTVHVSAQRRAHGQRSSSALVQGQLACSRRGDELSGELRWGIP